MKLRPVPSSLAITALAALLINGCGGAAGTVAGGGSSGQIGNLTFAIVGAAQNPVTSSAAYGANVTAIAGALVDRLTLNLQGPGTLADTKIVFESNRDGNQEIYTCNSDGTNQTRLTNSPSVDWGACWSPDGSKIAFSSFRDGNYEIYTMNADGTAQTRLTNTIGLEFNPKWSPDGTKIAFYSDRDGNGEIYSMKADGTSQTRLTNNASYDAEPCWSPNSNQIVFTSQRDGNSEIYRMNANGTGQTRLTNNVASDVTPSWSPDGTRISFTTVRDGNYEIYVMNTDGSSQTRVTNSPTTDQDSVWSPDGTKLAFTSLREGDEDIFTANVFGGAETNISSAGDSAIDIRPAWSGYLPRSPKTLVGPSGALGTAAAGFLFGQKDLELKSVVTFDTTTVGSRSASRVINQTANETQGSNLIFSITTSAGLASVNYASINTGGIPGTAISPTIPAGSTAAIVSFSASQGIVTSVLPYAANRSVTKQETSGDNLTYTGSFTAVFNDKGTNLAPNGASSITLNAKTGELVSYIKN